MTSVRRLTVCFSETCLEADCDPSGVGTARVEGTEARATESKMKVDESICCAILEKGKVKNDYMSEWNRRSKARMNERCNPTRERSEEVDDE